MSNRRRHPSHDEDGDGAKSPAVSVRLTKTERQQAAREARLRKLRMVHQRQRDLEAAAKEVRA